MQQEMGLCVSQQPLALQIADSLVRRSCERCIPEVALKELRDCAADFDSAMQQLRDLDSSDNIHPDTALSCCVQLEACLEVRISPPPTLEDAFLRQME